MTADNGAGGSTAPVVTRFAPSPTGFLHIGGARTALFNWLFARGRGGKFLLRIEDTDRARYTPEAVQAILDGLTWLGLDWDGDAISQFERAGRHREVAEQMLASGAAYRCYSTTEEIQAFRDAAKAAGTQASFQSPWRDHDGPPPSADAPFSVRLRAPRDGETRITDAVQGDVSWKNETLDDLILLRSDGTPTYMLAVVVDDHDMGVTHVIRGDDHLTNAARQALIYAGLGWATPQFAHIPLIHGPDGAKLSKRHGALGVEAYADLGYLPEAMQNYLARLGWSHGDDEFFTTGQATEWFGLEGVGKAPARLDFAKLDHINALHMRAMDDAELAKRLEARLSTAISDAARTRLTAAMPALKQRAKTLVDLEQLAYFAVVDGPLEYDDKSKEALGGDFPTILRQIMPKLQASTEWTEEEIKGILRDFAEQQGLKFGQIAQPIRAALTGRASSPGALDVMAALGKDETLARLSALAA